MSALQPTGTHGAQLDAGKDAAAAKAQINTAITDSQTALADLTTGWAALDTAGKTAALRAAGIRSLQNDILLLRGLKWLFMRVNGL